MKPQQQSKTRYNRAGERGAALVTMLLASILLLGVGGALITTTMMSANNSMTSTAEMQAYYVAESGMQSALNVLRGNTAPLVNPDDRMSFRTAIIPSISNGGKAGVLRFAGWLPYKDPGDPNSLVPVPVGAVTGGYRVTIENLDPNSHIVQFQTSATIDGSVAGTPSQKTFGTAGGTDEVTIRYSGQPSTTLTPDPNNFPLTLDSVLGSFIIERPVTSTQNDVVIPKTGFEITITQSLPWAATTYLEGTFEGDVDTAGTTVKVTFDKATLKADGTRYALNLASGTKVLDLNYTSSPGTTSIPARVTSPDPKRLLIKSYGFGPLNSEKRLEMMVNKANFEFDMPAGVTFRGADDCTAISFDSGSSGAKTYSGVDHSGIEAQRPAFAVTGCDQDDVDKGIKKHDTVVDPEIGILGDDETTPGTVDTPSFLDNADRARAYLNSLEDKANATGRYFESTASNPVTINDSVNSPMFTFCDGNCALESGSGFLVVTGRLTMNGHTNFKGAILVLGKGELIRNGGGNGDIFGGITVAAFNRSAGNFTAPTFHTNGGGNSTIQYDSAALKNAIGSGTNVSGVREF
ncbi:MAG TPA: pilus assembly PilX N-terminal domain-containing protein [Pyrinomonadaceae bacterium]|nr:pilus assembly PilX N-terminal domain-containing protein [Pyrinomonadaceae bacterium]